MTPGVWVFVLGYSLLSPMVIMHYIFKNHLLYPRNRLDKSKCIVMTKVGSTKIDNCLTPGVEVLVPGRGHISHIVKLHCPLLYQYNVHWFLIVLRDYNAAFYWWNMKQIINLLVDIFILYYLQHMENWARKWEPMDLLKSVYYCCSFLVNLHVLSRV